jgi:hypothetical protein
MGWIMRTRSEEHDTHPHSSLLFPALEREYAELCLLFSKLARVYSCGEGAWEEGGDPR